VREFSQEVLNAGKGFGTRITTGDHGYQDETKNPVLARQIIKNVRYACSGWFAGCLRSQGLIYPCASICRCRWGSCSGYDASSEPTKLSQGSYGIQPEHVRAIDTIIRNPEEFAAQRGPGGSVSAARGAAPAAPAAAAGAGFCANCGAAKPSAGAKFCGSCGNKL